MLQIEQFAVNPESLAEYSKIPMVYEVQSELSVILQNDGIEGIHLQETPVDKPYLRDFDELDGKPPTRWLKNFDTKNWVLWVASENGIPIGGATVACRTPGVNMLAGREDISVLWDIRIHPDYKRSGTGTELFSAASKWSREQDFTYMKIESQNVNVPACRFYAKQGCKLGEINRFAYTDKESLHETMLVWYFDL